MDAGLLKKLEALANEYLSPSGGKVEHLIGSGGSAAVFKAIKAGKAIALKVYDPKFLAEDNGPAELKRIELQRQLIGKPCPSLVDTDSVQTILGSCFIEMEYLPWPSLKDSLANVPIESVELLVSRLAQAAIFLEGLGLVHRDIKPENILVSPDFTQIKLIDLGVVRKMDSEEDAADATDHGHRRPFIATAQYSSPEYLFRLEAPSADSWRALTIYQIGGVIHDLVVRRPLFDSEVQTKNKFAVAMAVLRSVPRFPSISPKLLSLAAVASKCLVKDPSLRLKIITWDLFSDTEHESSAAKLNRVAKLSKPRRMAQIEFEQLLAARKKQRKRAIEATAQRIKTAVLASTDGDYRVTSSGKDERTLQIRIGMSATEVVLLEVTFEWDDTNPLSPANVSLKGSVAPAVAAAGEAFKVAEFDPALTDFTIFDEILLTAVADMLVSAADVFAAGSEAEHSDLAKLVMSAK
jgi:eukaryotic-like serine/threonine-protein kinase